MFSVQFIEVLFPPRMACSVVWLAVFIHFGMATKPRGAMRMLRRIRDRRVAIRHSQGQSLEVKNMFNGSAMERTVDESNVNSSLTSYAGQQGTHASVDCPKLADALWGIAEKLDAILWAVVLRNHLAMDGSVSNPAQQEALFFGLGVRSASWGPSCQLSATSGFSEAMWFISRFAVLASAWSSHAASQRAWTRGGASVVDTLSTAGAQRQHFSGLSRCPPPASAPSKSGL